MEKHTNGIAKGQTFEYAVRRALISYSRLVYYFQLVKKADSSSEVAIFKQGKRVPPEERLATGQDKPEQRWTTPTLIVDAEESLDLIISSFVYYAKIKIDSMGGFASVQSAGVYSAGIGNVVSAVTGPAALS